jgi:glucose/mannose-6-phosphate isomerase
MTAPSEFSESVLDSAEALEALDSGEMLRAIASSGAQVRQAATTAGEVGLDRLTGVGRPRSVVVAGMGGSAIAGQVLAAVAGPSCPIPVTSVHGYHLPGWVGAVDLVIAVSCSGTTEETLAVAEEASRRGCQLITVAVPGSPLAAVGEQAHGIHVPVDDGGRPSRANIWALSVPLLMVADTVGLADVPASVLDATADLLDTVSTRCRPASESFVNPAKSLAVDLAGNLPMLWGSSELAGVAAYRFACQLHENSKYPAMHGALPDVSHHQVVTFDGPFGRQAGPVDLFADRVEEPEGTRLRLVLLRDRDEDAPVARRREIVTEMAEGRGVAVNELVAEGEHRLERLASLVVMADYTSAYLALALGIDPTPVAPITEWKERGTV